MQGGLAKAVQRQRCVLVFPLLSLKRREALEIELEQNHVDDTFARLWQWWHNQKTKFDHLAGFNSRLGLTPCQGRFAFSLTVYIA